MDVATDKREGDTLNFSVPKQEHMRARGGSYKHRGGGGREKHDIRGMMPMWT
jgi:hypothetical protein